MGGVVEEKVQVGIDIHFNRMVRVISEELVEVLFREVDGDDQGIY